MNKHDISTLIHFNFWANGRLLTACEQLTQELLLREMTPDPGWGSLLGILVHILDAEYGWRSVLQAEEANTILEVSDFANVAALKASWDSERAAWFNFVSSLSDDLVSQTHGQEGKNRPHIWQTIVHVVTHGIQHRGEAAFILTGYGHSPGELDFDVFLQENPEFKLG